VESLIAFSNRHYYDGGLLTFPSPLTLSGRSDDGPDGYGVCLRRVEGGTYYGERTQIGRSGIRPGTNPVEARQVVEEVVRRFEAAPEGAPSLGVITFNARQRDLIETMLRKKLDSQRVDEALRVRDGLFLRNLENAQGEERDAILFSLTFSANERGDIPLSFGSLGHAGGERRLNVAKGMPACSATSRWLLPDRAIASRMAPARLSSWMVAVSMCITILSKWNRCKPKGRRSSDTLSIRDDVE